MLRLVSYLGVSSRLVLVGGHVPPVLSHLRGGLGHAVEYEDRSELTVAISRGRLTERS